MQAVLTRGWLSIIAGVLAACSPYPTGVDDEVPPHSRGVLRLTASTLGASPLASQRIELRRSELPVFQPNGKTAWFLPAGRFGILIHPAFNCRITEYPPDSVDVSVGKVTDIGVGSTCIGRGTVGVGVSAIGEEVPAFFRVEIGRLAPPLHPRERIIGVGETATVDLLAGESRAKLDLPVNCSESGDGIRELTVDSARVEHLQFDVTCVRYTGTLRVAVILIGTPPSAPLGVDIDGECSSFDLLASA